MTEACVVADHLVQIEGGPEFACRPGESLLRGALRAGLGFPYECSSGGCGGCQFELLEGSVEDLWPQAPGLSVRARCSGRRLACQSEVTTDCSIKVRLKPSYVLPKPASSVPARFVSKHWLTRDMAEFSFQTGEPADFLPGQYALLELPGVQGRRAYSMSNLSNEDGVWSFIVKRVPNGHGTAKLFDALSPGDSLTLDGPYGMSYLRSDAPRDIVCVGGGSGVSPLMSIINAAVRDPSLANRRIHLFYGGRTPEDICVDELVGRNQLTESRVEVRGVISEAGFDQTWEGERGFVHEALARWLDEGRNASNYEFYFCGPPPMTDAVQRLLQLERRVPARQLHFDRFL